MFFYVFLAGGCSLDLHIYIYRYIYIYMIFQNFPKSYWGATNFAFQLPPTIDLTSNPHPFKNPEKSHLLPPSTEAKFSWGVGLGVTLARYLRSAE